MGGFASVVSIGAQGDQSSGRVPVIKVARGCHSSVGDALEYWHKRRRGGVALKMTTIATEAALK